jgi:hypothetical protein
MFDRAFLAIGLLLVLSGCGRGEHPFLMVQFCFTEKHGPSDFKSVLQDIASDEGMSFGDRSEEAQAGLQAIDDLPEDITGSFPLIVVGVRKPEYGLGAGNAGLGANQVSLGFGPDSPAARSFARRTVARLNETWDVVAVPDGQGAFPLQCATEASA